MARMATQSMLEMMEGQLAAGNLILRRVRIQGRAYLSKEKKRLEVVVGRATEVTWHAQVAFYLGCGQKLAVRFIDFSVSLLWCWNSFLFLELWWRAKLASCCWFLLLWKILSWQDDFEWAGCFTKEWIRFECMNEWVSGFPSRRYFLDHAFRFWKKRGHCKCAGVLVAALDFMLFLPGFLACKVLLPSQNKCQLCTNFVNRLVKIWNTYFRREGVGVLYAYI